MSALPTRQVGLVSLCWFWFGFSLSWVGFDVGLHLVCFDSCSDVVVQEIALGEEERNLHLTVNKEEKVPGER